MKREVEAIHIRLKSGKNLQPGNLDLDKNHLVVVPLFGEFFAVLTDLYYHGKVSNALIRIIHSSDFVILDTEPGVEPEDPDVEPENR